MSIGNNIKRLRESKGMTQYALSKAIGVSQQSIDQWERGLSNPRKKNMDKIAGLFNVTPNELFGIFSKPKEELRLQVKTIVFIQKKTVFFFPDIKIYHLM